MIFCNLFYIVCIFTFFLFIYYLHKFVVRLLFYCYLVLCGDSGLHHPLLHHQPSSYLINPRTYVTLIKKLMKPTIDTMNEFFECVLVTRDFLMETGFLNFFDTIVYYYLSHYHIK